jgi:hypothetical protein
MALGMKRGVTAVGRRIACVAIGVAAGCSVGSSPGEGDAGTADAAPAGLTIEWESRPENIPGAGPSDSFISAAELRLADLRVVGDAGPLALGAVTLAWAAEVSPAERVVDDAPSGLYSRCLFDLSSYEISGTVEVDDVEHPFTIRDTTPIAVSFAYSIMLPPGGQAEIPVRVAIGRLVGAVEFAQVPLQDGRYVIEPGSPQLERVRDELDEVFDTSD